MVNELVHDREDISDLIIPRLEKEKIFLPGLKRCGRHFELPENFMGEDGNIPRITVIGDNLPEAWENALLATYWAGGSIRTEYDDKDSKGNFVDPPSIDCSMNMIILDPVSEPLIHRCFPGGLDALEEYRQEVIDGIKDFMIRDSENPADTKWEYTYHERLFSYKVPGIDEPIDQVEKVIEMLAKSPISRRVQAITWQPWADLGIGDPACLQRFWFRMMQDKDGAQVLNTNMNFRSRDGYNAAFMNCFAFVDVIKYVAEGISELRGEPVKVGTFQDTSDSFHIYGRYLGRNESGGGFETAFLPQLRKRSFEERTWTSEFAEPIFAEARPIIANKIETMKEKYKK